MCKHTINLSIKHFSKAAGVSEIYYALNVLCSSVIIHWVWNWLVFTPHDNVGTRRFFIVLMLYTLVNLASAYTHTFVHTQSRRQTQSGGRCQRTVMCSARGSQGLTLKSLQNFSFGGQLKLSHRVWNNTFGRWLCPGKAMRSFERLSCRDGQKSNVHHVMRVLRSWIWLQHNSSNFSRWLSTRMQRRCMGKCRGTYFISWPCVIWYCCR